MHWRPAIYALLGVALAQAARLPVKTYTTSDGLAHDFVHRIVQDRRGFLWICTEEGLSRFDGYEFINYTAAQGLPRSAVMDFLETSNGQYWVATGEGVYRFDPAGRRKFQAYFPREDADSRFVRALLQDRAGRIWCATRGGLFELKEGHFQEVDLGVRSPVRTLIEDRRGALWIGGANGLYRRSADGRIEHFTERNGLLSPQVVALAEGRDGRIWVATFRGGLARLVAEPNPSEKAVDWSYAALGIGALYQASDGRLWAGGWAGAVRQVIDADGAQPTIRSYSEELRTHQDVNHITGNGNGDLWLSTANGIMRVAREGFTVFGEEDGLTLPTNGGLFTDRSGEICGHFPVPGGIVLNRFDGRRFVPLWDKLPQAIQRLPGWGPHRALQDGQGDWWIGTGAGLYRFAMAGSARPKAIYTKQNGLSGDHVFSLYPDVRGDLWIAVESSQGLCHWSRAQDQFQCQPVDVEANGNLISAMGEDREGNLWIGKYHGGVLRLRGGRLEPMSVPGGFVSRILRDRAGRLWIAFGEHGVLRLDDSAAEHPRFTPYTTANGLATDAANDLAEDEWGRIYVATDRGVCRLDPASPRVRCYNSADGGLPENRVRSMARDGRGALWFATLSGIARFTPSEERPAAPPAIVMTGLRIAGRPWPVSELGELDLRGISAEYNQNQVQVQFAGLGGPAGERLRYQYRLAQSASEWSAPSEQRSLTLAGLAPGAYTLEVRALGGDGQASARPARLAFVIDPPLWRRAWFLSLAATLTALLVYGLHRQRVARLIELERVRTRIAGDLHDEIGSGLSQVAILSEVTREQLRAGSTEAAETAGQIADTARTMVDAMSDIVWSIDPRRDELGSLLQRVRRFASDVLDARGIVWCFDAADELASVRLTPDQRRQVYLILKEAIHNAARHAEAQSVKVRVSVSGGRLAATVADDGHGFAASNGHAGYGLESMRARAARLNGRLRIDSAPGHGTVVSLEVGL